MSLRLKVRLLGFSSGTPLVVVDDSVASALGAHAHDRLVLKHGVGEAVAVVNVARHLPSDVVLVNDEVAELLKLREGDEVEVDLASQPRSTFYIRDFINRVQLTRDEIHTIVKDIVEDRLSEVELTALVVAAEERGLSVEEAFYFAEAMVETGERLELGVKPILDKHSIGGVPGDKTTLIAVPILASLGYHIPKTSSRAITSPAGTADRAEVLMPVNLSIEEIKRVVLKVGGCIAWGGALRLAPADDKIIRVEYPLLIDPFLVASIMAKKVAVGATHVVVDIPVGRGTKVKTLREAEHLARTLIEVGRRLGLYVVCGATFGDQPVGRTAGPALEAREALQALTSFRPVDLVDKAVGLVGLLLELIGVREGRLAAMEALTSGKAYAKMLEIIEAQGGDPGVKPEDIPVGGKTFTLKAERGGIVTWINNTSVATVARLAGAPKDKGSGVELHVKLGDHVRVGDPLITVYSEHSPKLHLAEKYIESNPIVQLGKPGTDMLLKKLLEPKLPLEPLTLGR
ncbi:MAG: AMP phosphorylase [Thermofilaceae archaeon]|nr:AMP phosphorylase [Thermofilaceae archaeon]MCX8180474.1 AMP phosphorylase [Thermofilaceae archaeon]MDW8003329.1 AMP phosphorylase [Thermofilaceae archaeon]